jgi:hypothetical protein
METTLRQLAIAFSAWSLLLFCSAIQASEEPEDQVPEDEMAATSAVKPHLRLVSARDHIEGSFLGSQSVYADESRIYLASFQGRLFVLARNPSANFPVLQVIEDTPFSLTAVRGDRKNIYTTSNDGNLRVYRKTFPLQPVKTVPLSTYGLSSLVIKNNAVYVGKGQSHLNADQQHVYLAELNQGDVGLEVPKKTLSPGLVYGEVFERNVTVIFDRATADRLFTITNPTDIFGRVAFGPAYVDSRILAFTVAGCCGTGVTIYDPRTFAFIQNIPLANANTVERRGRWLVAGTESGQVYQFEVGQNPAVAISSVNLRQLTGHNGSEDIEIRALWADHRDGLIFAGSSWGNDQSRRPDLPSFFVLELAK